MAVLVTGGLGYIGSHTVVELMLQHKEVIIVDNCSNADRSVLEGIYSIVGRKPAFEKRDVKSSKEMRQLAESYPQVEGIIHFAAHKFVEESTRNPLMYYANNVGGLVCLLQAFQRERAVSFIFSSSCAVYGAMKKLPISEKTPWQEAASPYGYTKQVGEQVVKQSCSVHPFLHATILRYFNPIGAHESGYIGEKALQPPQNLVPIITQTAVGRRAQLIVYGGDYATPDGTCIRDYVHVVDLAQAHVLALHALMDSTKKESDLTNIYNVGTGKGHSVLELIQSFVDSTGVRVPYTIAERRDGDIAATYADVSLIQQQLGWHSLRSLQDALVSAWKWEQAQRKG